MFILSNSPKFENRRLLHFVNGNNQNIINTIVNSVPAATKQVLYFAENFKTNSYLKTANKIFNFLKVYITYKKDYSGQLIQYPSALLFSKNGDCKSYALLTVAILKSLKMPAFLRFACYNNSKIPSHVYAYTVINNKIVIIDGCYTFFAQEKKFVSKIDYKV